MQPKLTVINKTEDIVRLQNEILSAEFVAFDIETTGLTKSHEIIGMSFCFNETEAYYVILSEWNVKENKLVYLTQDNDYKDSVTDLIGILPEKKLICHNGIFDCSMAESYFKIRLIDSLHTDTMILAHLLNENRRVGLKELATSMYGDDSATEAKEMKESVAKNGGTLTQANYEMYKADSQLMGKYGAKDALLTYKLFLDLVPELYNQGLDKFFYEDESMPLLRGPTYDLNTTGTQVDTAKLSILKKTLEAECLEAKAFIHNEIQPYIKDKYPGTNKKNQFNLGASQQLSWLLFGQLGLEFNTLTKVGKEVCKALCGRLPYTYAAKKAFIFTCAQSKGHDYVPAAIINGKAIKAKKVRDPWAYIMSDKRTLQKYAKKYKWIECLLEYQRKTKLLNTYVEGIESRVQYGIIYSSFLQHGTSSGRYSSRNPNWQNLPRDDKRIKECVTARPGKVFVGADYSQLEPRVFAYVSGDPKLLTAFDGTDDFYSVIGMEVYDKTDCTPQKEGSPNAFGIKYKRLRDLSKVIALASTYGATANQLAPTTGKSIEDTNQDIENYFERFPRVREMMLESHELAKNNGQVINIFGRPRRMPDAKKIPKMYGTTAHADLPYEARKLLNLAVNHRIQSTAASIVNRAMIQFYKHAKETGINCRVVVQVHDSIVVECKEVDADNVACLLQTAMENTTQLKGIRLEAIPKIGKNLAEV
jgi:DNA polymerase I-like protein with 3'-5' exonuclease and polymerase domains